MGDRNKRLNKKDPLRWTNGVRLSGTAIFLLTIMLISSSIVQAGVSEKEEAVYIVFKDATGTVKAKNGFTGEIDFSSTDAATVIQSAINNGKLIHIKEGTYELATSIVVAERSKKITGAGRRATILKLSNGVNQDVIKGNGMVLQGLSFSNFGIDGNKLNNISGNGLNVSGIVDSLIEDVEINNAPTYGIFGNGYVARTDVITLRNVWVRGSGSNGIHTTSCYGWNLYAVYTDSNQGHGIVVEGAEWDCYGVESNQDNKCGFLLDASHRINLMGCSAKGAGEEGLRMEAASQLYQNIKHKIEGFIAINCANQVTGTAGIRIKGYASRVVLVNCIATGSNKRGLSLEDNADYVLVQGCDFSGNVGGAVNNTSSGTHNKFTRNISYVTENGGVTNVKNGDTIAHGLAVTPTMVSLTPSVAKRTIACTTKDAITITISLYNNNNPITTPENVYWYVEY